MGSGGRSGGPGSHSLGGKGDTAIGQRSSLLILLLGFQASLEGVRDQVWTPCLGICNMRGMLWDSGLDLLI